jgi:predicted regulator of Ras-like GTPase activity (Roadblock/LC7/MglB family)
LFYVKEIKSKVSFFYKYLIANNFYGRKNMALWGNNDAKGSGGTVSLNYDTLIVTGSGTTFGQVGAAATGDVIRFGDRAGTYFGDAIIVGIASTTQLSIGRTCGLSGAAISGVQFDISELPKYTIKDKRYQQIFTDTTETTVSATTTASLTAAVGVATVAVASTTGIIVGDTLVSNSLSRVVSSIGATTVSLASTISSAITSGSVINFTRVSGGYEASVYGVADAGIAAAQGTVYELTHEGWVGIQTYKDAEGNLRVKKEVLVAMSGITTGNTPLYDSNPLV